MTAIPRDNNWNYDDLDGIRKWVDENCTHHVSIATVEAMKLREAEDWLNYACDIYGYDRCSDDQSDEHWRFQLPDPAIAVAFLYRFGLERPPIEQPNITQPGA